ncbi:hypothetical protein [Mucilaginibacter ginsenosidivorax]|uniref:Uncharacterized protein n=1 Tax=Mucilaginibacter ginsenosidivorax TaxID=862126 RepID=A0A5B8VWF1_9SPHI|nr:hypothetical protein [Mucilaginibacter ginsenosidivorax]QEC75917.1 hypothetical protein FSB76_08135 [Mucilaginibacter ginsenosidivorax]
MKTLFVRIKTISPLLYYCALGHLALFILMLIIAQFDHRQLMGINLWTKPIKFAISIAIYCLTWPLLLQYLPYEQLKRRFVNFTVFAMSFEMLAIATQAARGQLSHYNTSGAYNALVFSTMGIVIVSQTLFALYIGIKFFKVKAVKLTPALLWAIRLGIIMACIFALEGGVMASRLAHTVGAADGSPGLPLFNWSRIAGDLRIAHFMGLHALQIIPLFVVFSGVKNSRPAVIFASVYFIAVSLLFYNAMLGRPLF